MLSGMITGLTVGDGVEVAVEVGRGVGVSVGAAVGVAVRGGNGVLVGGSGKAVGTSVSTAAAAFSPGVGEIGVVTAATPSISPLLRAGCPDQISQVKGTNKNKINTTAKNL
jgi:hypothetical protein